ADSHWSRVGTAWLPAVNADQDTDADDDRDRKAWRDGVTTRRDTDRGIASAAACRQAAALDALFRASTARGAAQASEKRPSRMELSTSGRPSSRRTIFEPRTIAAIL